MLYTTQSYQDVIKKTVELVSADPSAETVVFCEDKLTLAIERALADKLGGSFFCEVTTLNRFYAKRSKTEVITKTASCLIVRKIIEDNRANLKCFGRGGVSLAKELFELISQLKSAKVTPQMLADCVDSEKCTGHFKNKLADVALIYGGYERVLTEKNLYDSNLKYSLLPNLIEKSEIGEKRVICAGFNSKTKQSSDIFKTLKNSAKSFDFVCVGGDSVFYLNEVRDFVKQLGESEQVVCYDDLRERLSLSLYSPKPSGKGKTDKITVSEFYDEYDELTKIAEDIKRACVSGSRYRDFLVVVPDYADSGKRVKKIFEDYELPVYEESSFMLSEHPIIKAVCVYLDLIYSRFDLKKYKAFLRQPVLFPEKDKVEKYIAFIEKYSYTARSVKEPFSEEQDAFYSEAVKLQQKSLGYLSLKGSPLEKVKQLCELSGAKENTLRLAEKLDEIVSPERAEFCRAGYEKAIELIEEIEKSEFELTSPLELKAVLLAGAVSCELSIIPQKSDCVYVGDVSACKYRSAKEVYVCAMTNQTMPKQFGDSAIFTDSDLKTLEDIKVLVEPKMEIVNKRNREEACLSLLTFSEKLHLSYSLCDLFGNENVKSEIVDYVLAEFEQKEQKVVHNELKILSSGTKQEKDDLAVGKYITGAVALRNFARAVADYRYGVSDNDGAFSTFYHVAVDKDRQVADDILSRVNATLVIRIEEAGKLFFKDGFASVTKIEDYYSCPYKNFAKNGLKLKEKEDGELKVYELGNVLHNWLEDFYKMLADGKVASKEEIKDIVNRHIDAYIPKEKLEAAKKNPAVKLALDSLRKEAVRIGESIYSAYLKTKFELIGTEIAFGFGDKKYPAIQLEGEHRFKVRGKIDRADRYEDYVRIIDYKTGSLKDGSASFEDEKLLYVGKKLQLYLYLNVFIGEDKGYKAGGVYYARIDESGYTGNTEEKESLLQGRTLKDEDVFRATDTDYCAESKRISVLGVKNVSNNKKKFTAQGDLENYSKYSKLLTGLGAESVASGTIIPSPYEDSCKYCSYKAMCGFDRDKYLLKRREKDVTATDIQNALYGKGESEHVD